MGAGGEESWRGAKGVRCWKRGKLKGRGAGRQGSWRGREQ